MPQFETLTYEKLDVIDDPADEAAAFSVHEVGMYLLPGVVMRQTMIQHERDRRPAIVGLGGLSALGTCMGPDTYAVGTANDPDFGFHRDLTPNGVSPKRRLIAFHNSLASPASVQLIKVQPHITQRELRLDVDSFDEEHKTKLKERKVDTRLLEPVCYTARLYPGDTLAFVDYRTLHSFSTIGRAARRFSVAYYPYTIEQSEVELHSLQHRIH